MPHNMTTPSKRFKPHWSSILMVVLWPAFLAACVATGVFFSLVDPFDLIILDGRVKFPALGAYTVGFFAFWLLCCFSSWMTVVLVQKIR
jgi:hypothetical protein